MTTSVVSVSGANFGMIDYGGVRFGKDVFRPSFEEDIGTHLIREVVHMLQVGRIEYIGADVLDFPICYQTPEHLNGLKSPRVLHTHMPYRFLPKQHLNNQGKMITVFRNPKDACVSLWHFMQGISQAKLDFQEFLDAFLAGKWMSNSWYKWRHECVTWRQQNPDYPMLVLRYEDMITNLSQALEKIAKYIEQDHSDEFLNELVKACDFKTMKAAKSTLTPDDAKYKQTINMTTAVVSVSGANFGMIDYGGVRFGKDVFRPNFEEDIGNLPCRDDDVFLVTYPRSGTHLIREVVHMLQVGRIEYIGADVLDFPICYQTPEHLNGLKSPCVLHTHMPYRFLPKQHLNYQGKMITVFRNPKDACVSLWHFMQGISQANLDFQDFLDAFLAGKWMSNSWYKWRHECVTWRQQNPDYPMLVLRYEDMITNLSQALEKIAKYLEQDHSDEFLNELVKACDFKTMKAAKSTLTPDDAKVIVPGGYDIYYRKGVIGDWKTVLTIHQNEQFDKWMKEQVEDNDSEFPSYLEFYRDQ